MSLERYERLWAVSFHFVERTHPTHGSMCGSHRPVLLTLLSKSLLPPGIGLEIAAAGSDTSSKQVIASVVHMEQSPQRMGVW